MNNWLMLAVTYRTVNGLASLQLPRKVVWWLLAGLVATIVQESLQDDAWLAEHTKGFESVAAVFNDVFKVLATGQIAHPQLEEFRSLVIVAPDDAAVVGGMVGTGQVAYP